MMMDSGSSATSPTSNLVGKSNSAGVIFKQQNKNETDNLPSDQSDTKLAESANDRSQHAKSHLASDEPAIGNDDYAFQPTRQSNGLDKQKFKLKSKFKTRSECKKLPVLTCVELVECVSKTNDRVDESINNGAGAIVERVNGETKTSISKTILFKDYVLISAKTKFKYLIHSIFKNTSLNSKENYKVLDGSLKLKNWVSSPKLAIFISSSIEVF